MIIVGVLGLIIAGAMLVIAMRPADFRIERSQVIKASPSALFDQVDDLHQWHQWSPWARRDPTMQVRYAGPPRGLGACYYWSGDRQVGKGGMTIVASHPEQEVRIALMFQAPVQAEHEVVFTFRLESSGTRVIWLMNGRNGFVGKAMSLFMDMDRMLGSDFEEGLATLKARTEATPTA